MKNRITIVPLGLAAAMVGLAAPVLAQAPPEEIVVTGNLGQAPDNVRTLSQAVSYADLDLTTDAGKKAIRQRISLTARFLCDKLGESASSTGPTPSCRDTATSDAMQRLGTLEENVAPRDTTWARPPAWTPPYPHAWSTLYP